MLTTNSSLNDFCDFLKICNDEITADLDFYMFTYDIKTILEYRLKKVLEYQKAQGELDHNGALLKLLNDIPATSISNVLIFNANWRDHTDVDLGKNLYMTFYITKDRCITDGYYKLNKEIQSISEYNKLAVEIQNKLSNFLI